MNRLRKIAAWLWLIKERMVLIVMVLFLCYRIYAVIYPEVETGEKLPQPPKGGPESIDNRPGSPPSLPRDQAGQDWSSTVRRNPFYWNENARQTDASDPGGETGSIRVLRVREVGKGKFKVQISTDKTRKKWYEEGDAFESYELLEIDPDTECCDIYAENLGKRITKCVE